MVYRASERSALKEALDDRSIDRCDIDRPAHRSQVSVWAETWTDQTNDAFKIKTHMKLQRDDEERLQTLKLNNW